MSYSTPLPNLLLGVKTFLKELTDADGNPLVFDAIPTPVELPVESQRPYALFGLDLATNRQGDVECSVVINLYLDAIVSEEGYLNAWELAALVSLSLQQALDRGELAEGVYGGTTRLTDFDVRFSGSESDPAPQPSVYLIQLRLTPQFQEE